MESVFDGRAVRRLSAAAGIAGCAVAMAAVSPAASAAVFVDAVGGNDGNPGTQSQPWKTLAKLAGARASSVYLKCGSTFRETLTLGATQLLDGSVVAGYGSCSTTTKAVISGANDFTGGWTKSGNIWRVRVPAGTPKITQLFINGAAQRTAQWPNFGGIGKEYALADASSPTSKNLLRATAVDAGTLAGKDLVGATIFAKDQPYHVSKLTVQSYGSGQFATTGTSTYNMQAGSGYMLQDKLWMLDAPGEFYHDQANGVLYVYPGDAGAQASLNNYSVEGTVRATGVQISDRKNLQVSNIAAVKNQTDGLVLSNTAMAVVDSVVVADNGYNGMRVIRSSAGAVVRNSVFARNAYVAFDASSVASVTLANSQVSDTGVMAYSGGSGAAINVGDGGVANANLVQRSAYSGVRYSATGGTRITGNVVEDSCQRFSDGAAIYTFNGAKLTANQSSLVESNVVARAPGNADGAVGGSSDMCVGIYADDMSRGGTIRNNVVIAVPFGINLHNAANMVVDSNKVWLAQQSALWMNMDHTDQDVSTGNVWSNNQINVASGANGAAPIFYWNKLLGMAGLSSGGNRFSGNSMLMLAGPAMTAATTHGKGGSFKLSSAQWRQYNPSEPAPAATAVFSGGDASQWAAAVYASPLAASTVDCPAFGWPAGCAVTDVNGTPVGLPLTLAAGTAKLLLRSNVSYRVK